MSLYSRDITYVHMHIKSDLPSFYWQKICYFLLSISWVLPWSWCLKCLHTWVRRSNETSPELFFSLLEYKIEHQQTALGKIFALRKSKEKSESNLNFFHRAKQGEGVFFVIQTKQSIHHVIALSPSLTFIKDGFHSLEKILSWNVCFSKLNSLTTARTKT